MELLLIAVVLIAIGLAAVMSAVAWKLLSDGRNRSAARVAHLEQMAYAEADADVQAEEVDRFAALDDWRLDQENEENEEEEDDDWDLAIRPVGRDARTPPPERRPEPARPAARVRIVQGPRREAGRPPAVARGDMFGSSAGRSPRPRRQGLAALLTAAALLLVGTGVVYAVRSAPSLAGVARQVAAPNPASLEPLELLSLRHSSDPTGAFTVTGLVENPVDGASLTGIVAVVYLFDEEGRYYAGGRAGIELTSFRPGEESPFVVVVPNAGRVSRYRVGFRFEDGGVVSHVDGRGRPPRGTTGDAVNGADAGTKNRPGRTPHRAEG